MDSIQNHKEEYGNTIKDKEEYGITIKDKLGYALGDTAGMLIFGMVGPFLQMFYTDVLFIDAGKIMVLFLVARLWDAINDPMWGFFIDSRKPTKHGKYRQYLKWFSIPLAISGVFLFFKLPGLSEYQYLIFAYITYIGYEMIYTGVNIPYGSLASVITSDTNERAELSAYRSVGSTIGGLPASIILPIFIYTVLDTGEKVLDSNKLLVAVVILAVFSIGIYRLSYRMIKERVASPVQPPKINILNTIKALITNRPFVTLCIASILLLTGQMYTQTMYNYLFKNYFGNPGLYSLVMVATYGPIVFLTPVMGKLVQKFGKKELCWVGALIAALSNVLLWILKINNPFLFLIFCFISGFGITFFAMEVWAMVTDVIDYHEYRTGRREEGTCFAFFSFTRKLGQTLAGVFSTYMLILINYDASKVTADMNQGMYSVATILPAILYLAIVLILVFTYPLSKKQLKILHENNKA